MTVTMTNDDVRWQQRMANYRKAFGQLRKIVAIARERALSDIELQALIKSFEYTHELAWKVIQDYFTWQGVTGISGSRDAFREAFQNGLISDGEGWMDMIPSRNNSVHAYNEEIARKVASRIIERHHDLFAAFEVRMSELEDGQ